MRARRAAEIALRLALIALGALAWFRPPGLWHPPSQLWAPVLAALAVAAAAGWLPGQRAEPEELRFRWIDPVIALSLALGFGGLLAAWAATVNPERLMVGMDSPTYLQNAWAAHDGNWSAYIGDKRAFHARIAGLLAGFERGDVIGACEDVSLASIAALPGLVYLAGVPLAGRVAGVGAALATIAQPLLWTFAIQTTNYAFYFAVLMAVIATASWAAGLARHAPVGHALASVLLGLASGACLLTSEKAPTVLIPLGVALAAGSGKAGLRGIPLSLGAAFLVAWLGEPPVRYTPFGNLIANQRQELHREMPWNWDTVKTPAPNHPSPASDLLPAAWRNGALESTLCALSTPPDSDILHRSIDSDPAHERWENVPETSIAPLPERLRQNAISLDKALGGRAKGWAGATGVGAFAALIAAPVDLPVLAVVLAVLPSALGPLTLKFVFRYMAIYAPVIALLVIGGTGRAARTLAGCTRGGRLVAGVVTAGVALAWSTVQWAGALDSWAHPSALSFALPAPPQDLDLRGYPLAMKHAAAWVATQPASTVYDCAPAWPSLLVPGGLPSVHRSTADCRESLVHPEPGALMIISDRREYAIPNQLSVHDVASSPLWEFVERFDAEGGRESVVGVYRVK